MPRPTKNAAPVEAPAEGLAGADTAPFIPSTLVPAINVYSVGKPVTLRVSGFVTKGGMIVDKAELMR
jgi:hypothetical protein